MQKQLLQSVHRDWSKRDQRVWCQVHHSRFRKKCWRCCVTKQGDRWLLLLLLTKPKLNVFFNAVAIVASIYTLLQVKLILWILLGLCPRYCEFGFLNFFPISNFSQVFCIKLRKTNSKISSHKEHIKERKQRFSLLTFLWRSLRVRQVKGILKYSRMPKKLFYLVAIQKCYP